LHVSVDQMASALCEGVHRRVESSRRDGQMASSSCGRIAPASHFRVSGNPGRGSGVLGT
jgi:hypothetical protein